MEIGATLNNRYTLTAELGKGAMGVVYKAIDAQTGQAVAVKVIARDLALDAEMLERFRREGEALRQLRHPNIVGFVDMFQHEGQQVIVMEFVPGGNLRDLLRREGPLPLERARQITLDLCDALIRAHRLNIIHRDLKPENVLLAEDGLPRLTDFGVARLANKSTYLTATGVQVGTPLYMSPEAWEGKPLDVQTDIWSLGVMLFEMLSGNVPFSGDTIVTVMNKVLTQPVPDLKALRRDTPDSLVRIVRRMLTRDKGQRYATARQVSADLEACALGSATAVPERRLTVSKMPALPKRTALLIGAAAVLFVSFCGLAAWGLRMVWPSMAGPTDTPMAQPTTRPTDRPATQGLPALATTVAPPPVRPTDTMAPLPAPTTTQTPAVSVPPAAGLAPAPPITAANAASLSQMSFGKIWGSPVDVALAPDGKTLYVASHFGLATYDLGNLDQTLYEAKDIGSANRMALSPDGSLLAIGNSSGGISLWDMTKGGVKLADLKGHTEAIAGLAFSPDGKLLASAGGRDKSMQLWDVAGGKALFAPAQFQGEVGSVDFSPDGATLAMGCSDKKVRLWDVASNKLKLELDAQGGDTGNVDALKYSPDGKLLVSAGEYDPAIHVWDAGTGEALVILRGRSLSSDSGHYGYYGLAFHPNSTLLAAAGHDNAIHLWDMDVTSPTGYKELAVLQRHADWVTGVAFSPDGGTLVSASERDGTVRLWQASTSAASAAPTQAQASVAPTVAPVIVAENAAALGEALVVKNDFSRPQDMALSAGGQTLAVASSFSTGIFDFGDLTKVQYDLRGEQGGAGRLAFSPSGKLLATASNTIWLWDIARGGVKLAELKGHTEAIAGIAFSPNGKLLASAGGRDRSMHVWDVENARELFVDTRQAEVRSVAFSPDGATLAVGYSDQKIRLWDVPALAASPKSANPKLELDVQTGAVGDVDSMVFSPDGKLLVSAGQYDPAIHVWDTQTWKPAQTLHASNPKDTHTGFYSLAFNPLGTLLAAGGADYSVRLWDMNGASATFGKELVVLQRHSDWVNCVLFTPDGTTLLSGSERDGTLRLWQVGAGK